eukprot:5357309-Alexandrium_andersonii.AAC.1
MYCAFRVTPSSETAIRSRFGGSKRPREVWAANEVARGCAWRGWGGGRSGIAPADHLRPFRSSV